MKLRRYDSTPYLGSHKMVEGACGNFVSYADAKEEIEKRDAVIEALRKSLDGLLGPAAEPLSQNMDGCKICITCKTTPERLRTMLELIGDNRSYAWLHSYEISEPAKAKGE